MSTISSLSPNQLSTTSTIGDSSGPASSSQTSSNSSNTSSTTSVKNDTAMLKSASVKKPQLEDILVVLKKVLEAVTSLLQFFSKEKPSASQESPNTPSHSSSTSPPSHCGATPRSAAETGGNLSGNGEFLWKPQSDKDGRLAILLPSAIEGQIESVSVVSPNGTNEKGQFAGVGNGGREHFRFSKPGGEFEDGSTVLIKMKDGTSKEVSISDSSARYQK